MDEYNNKLKVIIYDMIVHFSMVTLLQHLTALTAHPGGPKGAALIPTNGLQSVNQSCEQPRYAPGWALSQAGQATASDGKAFTFTCHG